MTIQKESTAKLQGVTETLMITLYGRYKEQSYPDCMLKDEKAFEYTFKSVIKFRFCGTRWF